jgi:N-acetylglucosaminyl-diphospho-decaprenol L-rhamnosyltransferase
MTDIDYIVLDRDGGVMLDACIASIRRQTLAPARVIVVDNGSDTPVSSRPAMHEAGIVVDRSETNLGFAAGVNRGFGHVRAGYVALINNDVVLAPDWSASVVAALESDDRCAAAQSVILRPDGRVDGAGIDISDGTYRQAGHGRPLVEVLSGDATAWGVSATAAIYRVAALRAVSRGDEIFDFRFFAYYEDVELAARLIEGGWRMAVVPLPKATHAGSATAPLLGRRAVHLRTRNRHWVRRLHPDVGRLRALLREDAASLVGLLFHGRLADAGMVAWGVLAGCFSSLR